MSRTVKIILIVIGSIVVVSIVGVTACVGACAYWWEQNSPELIGGSQRMAEEGATFGASSTEQGCVDDAVRRIEDCGNIDLVCQTQSSAFISFCLRAAPKEPTFCDPIPPATAIFRGGNWANMFCRERGRANHQPCNNVAGQIVSYCGELRAGGGTLSPNWDAPPLPPPTPSTAPSPAL